MTPAQKTALEWAIAHLTDDGAHRLAPVHMATIHSLLSSSDEMTRLQLDLSIEKTLREGANKADERWQNAHFALEQESEAEIKALQARVAELERERDTALNHLREVGGWWSDRVRTLEGVLLSADSMLSLLRHRCDSVIPWGETELPTRGDVDAVIGKSRAALKGKEIPNADS